MKVKKCIFISKIHRLLLILLVYQSPNIREKKMRFFIFAFLILYKNYTYKLINSIDIDKYYRYKIKYVIYISTHS